MSRFNFTIARAIVCFALAIVLVAGSILNVASAQDAPTVIDKKLYAGLAPYAGMVGSSAEFQTGQGSWNSNRSVVELYIVPENSGLEEKTIGDIASVEYYSNNAPINTAGISEGVDFAFYIYTKGTENGFYGERLTAEPLYSIDYSFANDPPNSWNRWTSDTLTWYSGSRNVLQGWSGAPTLAQLQTPGFQWSTYWPAGDPSVVDYNAMKIWAFKFGTGTSWSQYFNGYLDAIQINFKDGDQLTLDLENKPEMLYVDDGWALTGIGQDPDGDGPAHAMGSDAFASIQPAINAAAEGATISIFPGTYPTGISATNVSPITGGPGANSFILFVNKPGLTLQGVNEDATPIAAHQNVAANITATASAPTFGASVLFIQADDVTVQGLEVVPFAPNKTIEVWGNNFTLRHSLIRSGQNASTVYFNDDKVSGYTIDQNFLLGGIAVSSGAGSTGLRSSRQITGNIIDSTIYGVGFRGTNPNVNWLTKPVGGAVIEANIFTGNPYGHVYAEGEYAEAELLWDEILAMNMFDKHVVMTNSAGELADNTWVFSYARPNLRRIASTIQSELNRAMDGDTLTASADLFPEELIFNPAVTGVSLIGAGADETIIEAADSAVGFTVTLTGPMSLIQGVTIRNNPATPNSMGISWGYQGSGSQLLESKIAGFPTGIYLSSGLNGAVIENNLITGNANGILLEGDLENTQIRFNDISANTLEDDFFDGRPNASIRVLDLFDGEGNVIEYNALVGSSRGIDNNAAVEIAAEKNWWGSKYGPAQGSLTEGSVDADPWLCSGVDTQPAAIGFQPTLGDTCTAGAAARLAFTAQPASTMVNKVFAGSPSLRVEDAAGSLVINFTDVVTLALDTNSQPCDLKGTKTVAAVDGIVSFPGLYADRWGTAFTLTASADGLTSATSSAFDILAQAFYLPMISRP